MSPTLEDVLGVPATEVPYRWTEFVTDHPINEAGMRHTQRAIETDLEPGVLHAVLDESQLDQVLLNLVVNARDAMPDGGRLTASARRVTLEEAPDRWGTPDEGLSPGRFVLLEVEDWGVGIPPRWRSELSSPSLPPA